MIRRTQGKVILPYYPEYHALGLVKYVTDGPTVAFSLDFLPYDARPGAGNFTRSPDILLYLEPIGQFFLYPIVSENLWAALH